MPADIRFALIGCGRITGNHLDVLSTMPRAAVAAVCDLIPEKARTYGERFGVPWYTNYHDMLTAEKVDVVCILTPSGMHALHALDILERYGTHLVIEKPPALRIGDLERVEQAATAMGRRLFPVYQNRYNKPVRKVYGEIQTGTFGRLVLGSVRVRWCRPHRYYDQSVWRGTWGLDGGCATNQGIHHIDLLLHLLGDVDTVYATTATQLVSVPVEDMLVASLRFRNGALATIEITTAVRPDDFEAEVSVIGEGGTAVIAGLAANRLVVFTPDPSECAAFSEEIPNAYGLGHRLFFEDVLADLLDGVSHPISWREGERAVRLLSAMYRSAEDGTPVKLADHPASARLGQFEDTVYERYLTPPAATVRT